MYFSKTLCRSVGPSVRPSQTLSSYLLCRALFYLILSYKCIMLLLPPPPPPLPVPPPPLPLAGAQRRFFNFILRAEIWSNFSGFSRGLSQKKMSQFGPGGGRGDYLAIVIHLFKMFYRLASAALAASASAHLTRTHRWLTSGEYSCGYNN